MSLFWQAALDPSAEAAHVTEAPTASMSYTSLWNQKQSLHHWIRDKDGTVGHVPATQASYFSTFTSTISISSRSFTQAEVAGLILVTGTGQWCQSGLTETWTAAGQHSWPKESYASWMVFLRVSTVPNHSLSNSEPQRWVHQYLFTTYCTVSISTSQMCGFNGYEKAFPSGRCYYSMDLL